MVMMLAMSVSAFVAGSVDVKEQVDMIIVNINEVAIIAKNAGIKSKEDLAKADVSVIDSIVAKAQTAAKVINLTVVSYNAKLGIINVKDSAGRHRGYNRYRNKENRCRQYNYAFDNICIWCGSSNVRCYNKKKNL